MKSFYILFIASFFMLSGCQTKPFKSQAVQEREAINLRMAAAMRNADMCSEELEKSNPKFSIIDSEILANKKGNPAKFTLMSSVAFLTSEQKVILKDFLTKNYKCRELRLAGFRGLPHYKIMIEDYNKFDVLYMKVLNEEITIGQLNQDITEILAKGDSKFFDAEREVDDRLRGLHDREVSEIQRKQEADRQYYLEYQRTLNQNQSDPLAPLQQLLQNKQNNKPKQTDYICQQKCMNQGSMYDFCEKSCSY
jgi:hypothetical protein